MVFRGAMCYGFMGNFRGPLLVGRGVRLRNPRKIKRGGRLIVEDFAEIQGLSKNGIVFGNNVSVGAYSIIRPSGYYSRELGVGLIVGDNSNIGIMSYLGCGGGVTIGDNVMMGPKVSIHSENHEFSSNTDSIKSQGVNKGEVIIENDCWLGAGCRVLAGVTIGEGSVVAAGAVVSKDVKPYSIVGGVPARTIKQR